MCKDNSHDESISDYPESVKLEAQLIQQDHRPFFIIKTFLFRKQWEDKNDPRRKAAVVAFAWLWLSPSHLAVSGGLITAVATLALLASQNILITKQNTLIKDQNDFFQEQITNEDTRAKAIEDMTIQSRRTNLVRILWNEDPNSTISGRERTEALLEFIKLERVSGRTTVNLTSANLSNTSINNADLNFCNFDESNIRNANWSNVSLNSSSLRYCLIENTYISSDFSNTDINLPYCTIPQYASWKDQSPWSSVTLLQYTSPFLKEFYAPKPASNRGSFIFSESDEPTYFSNKLGRILAISLDNGLLLKPTGINIHIDDEHAPQRLYDAIKETLPSNPVYNQIFNAYDDFFRSMYYPTYSSKPKPKTFLLITKNENSNETESQIVFNDKSNTDRIFLGAKRDGDSLKMIILNDPNGRVGFEEYTLKAEISPDSD